MLMETTSTEPTKRLSAMNKKVLVIGAFSSNPTVYTYASSFYKAFQNLGFDTTYINYRQPIAMATIVGINRITATFATMQAQKKILAAVKKHMPWLVFILKGECITPATIRAIKQTGARVVNFYPDNPFALWNNNSTELVLKSLPLFDCFLSWSQSLTPALLASGSRHICPFPFAFDSNIFHANYTFTPTELATYASDVCFVGTWEPKREQLLSHAIAHMPHVSFAIWGNDWKKNAVSPHIKKSLRGSAIYGKEMLLACQAAKISLNILRDQNAESHNMRSFEIPASNIFMLSERSSELTEKIFTEEHSIASFSGKDQLIKQINYYLEAPKKRKYIAQAAHKIVAAYALEKQLSDYLRTCPVLR
jgi:spore maturation protein CgeB